MDMCSIELNQNSLARFIFLQTDTLNRGLRRWCTRLSAIFCIKREPAGD